jgi:hypothetical protein
MIETPMNAVGACLSLGLVFFARSAQADLFSPGPLAKPHSNLEGLNNCTTCHSAGEQVAIDKCLSCHSEIKPQLVNGTGLHGHIPAGERACERCHHEHQGRDFALIEWAMPKKSFPHNNVGFPLRGKHAEVECNQCHQRRLVHSKQVVSFLAQHPHRETFLGLSTKCSACHFDEHRGQLGDACQDCHHEQGWKPAPGFDHNETQYPLTGRHQKVACSGCHPSQEDERLSASQFPAPRSRSFIEFQGVPHQSCHDCHRDPHQGKFGARCASCHNTAGWGKVRESERGLDLHDKTRFPLEGLHQDVPCKSCHGPFPGRRAKFRGLSFQTCGACHPDGHEGQLAKANLGSRGQCEACHTVDGFVPARFEVQDHQKTGYPLEGAHLAVPCAACHPQEPTLINRVSRSVRAELRRKKRPELFSLTLFDLGQKGSRCQNCHADPHGNQFASKLLAGELPTGRGVALQGCTVCHQLTSFADLKFDHNRDSRFQLTGKHASTACAGCHVPNSQHIVQYRPLDTGCQSCHADVHAKQFWRPGEGTDCARCHATEAFQKTSFVHAPPFTSFVLQDKHASLPCKACHPTVIVSPGVAVRRFRFIPTNCEGCHVDVHHGRFHGLASGSAR